MSPATARARRRTHSALAQSLAGVAVVLLFAPSAAAVGTLFSRGARSVAHAAGWDLLRAAVGSLLLVGLTCLVAIPSGVVAGLFVAEHRGTPSARVGRVAAAALADVPSIVIGLGVHGALVTTGQSLTFFTGALTLALLVAPTVAHTTAEAAHVVPTGVRDAAIALGATRWRTSAFVVLRAVRPRVSRVAAIAVARAAGAAAPLLLVAGSTSGSASRDVDALPLLVFAGATTPGHGATAWTAALALTLVVAATTTIARRQLRGGAYR